MANLIGTNIIAGIIPFSSEDIFSTHFAKYGHGGFRTVKNIDERNSIKELRRENLMLVAVEYNSSSGTSGTIDNIIYQLVLGTIDNDLTNNDNWVEFQTGSGDDWILPPPISTFAPGIKGQRSFDNDFLYICIETNTWKRISMDYFNANFSTSSTAANAPEYLDFGDVPVFGNNSWTFVPIIKDINGTTGNLTIVYTDNTSKEIDLFGTAGFAVPTLEDVLISGNVTGANNIYVNSGQKLQTNGGLGSIEFASNSVYIYSDNGGYSNSILGIDDQYAELSSYKGGVYSYSDTYTVLEGSNGNGIIIEGGTDQGFSKGGIFIKDNSSLLKVSPNVDSSMITIGSKNSTFNAGIINSVAIGGDNLIASSSGTVYVPNLELQGNVLGRYTIQPFTQPGWNDLSIPTKKYVDDQIATVSASTTGMIQIISPDDKFLSALTTTSDGDLATNNTISNTPTDGCYVSLYVNGEEFEVGNGVKTKVSYFSNDGGTNARGFDSSHPNGQVQAGDSIYWNGSIAGVELVAGWRISLLYIVNK